MAMVPRRVNYPVRDGKPMAESDVHRKLMINLIDTLTCRFASEPSTYVSGNLMMFSMRRGIHVATSPRTSSWSGVSG